MPLRAHVFRNLAALCLVIGLTVTYFGQETKTPEQAALVSLKMVKKSVGIKPGTAAEDEPASLRTIAEQESIVAANPADAVALNDLGVLYVEATRYQDGIAAIRRSIELDQRVSRSHFNLSVAYDLAGDPTRALPPAKKAAEKYSDDITVVTHFCEMQFVLKKYSDALQCYERATRKWPADLLTRSNYAAALLVTNRSKRAIAVLEEIIAAWPNYAGAYNALGVIQQQTKDRKAAAVSFRRAVEIAPNMPLYRYNLALACLASKNKAGAISQYGILKTADPVLAAQLYKQIYSGKIIHVPKLEF